MLKLYDYFRSSASYRVRITLNLKQLSYDKFPVHLINGGGEQFSPQYHTINPHNLVPTLQDGSHILTQSFAIMEYLNEQHPNPPLLPMNAYERALVRAFALSIVADIHPLNNLRVLKYLSEEFHINEEQKKRWYQHWISKGLLALETQLHLYHMTGDFCFGNTPTFADICLIPQLYNARRFNCDLSRYETLLRVETNCQRLSAFMNAAPMESVST